MSIVRLPRHQHPRPPHHELRQHSVLDCRGRLIGDVGRLYVDESEQELRFVEVVTEGFLGLRKQRYLVPAEVIVEEGPGSITLAVDQETVEASPGFSDRHTDPDPGLQRAILEHYARAEKAARWGSAPM